MRAAPYHKHEFIYIAGALISMSMSEKGLCVRILEKEFRVACSRGQEQALREAAQFLDRQMRQIRQTGRVIGLERIAVMAALNIANELMILKNTVPERDTFSDRLKVLQDKIDGVLSQDPTRRSATGTEQAPKWTQEVNGLKEILVEMEETV